jgi:hypothetical protein
MPLLIRVRIICFNIACCFRFPRYYLLRCVDSTCLTASPRTCSTTTRLSLADTGWTHISSIRASARQHYHIETHYAEVSKLEDSLRLTQNRPITHDLSASVCPKYNVLQYGRATGNRTPLYRMKTC